MSQNLATTHAALHRPRTGKQIRDELQRHAWKWDNRTHKPREHTGILGGHKGIAILRALNRLLRGGRSNPSQAEIAAEAGCSLRTAAKYLLRFKKLGVITWPPNKPVRCRENGRWKLVQKTNIYEVRPHTEWVGYCLLPPPLPDPDTMGTPEPMQVKGQDIVETELRTKDETDSKDHVGLLQSLHSLGGAIERGPQAPPTDIDLEADEADQARAYAALRAHIGDAGVAEWEAEKATKAALAAAELESIAARRSIQLGKPSGSQGATAAQQDDHGTDMREGSFSGVHQMHTNPLFLRKRGVLYARATAAEAESRSFRRQDE